MKQYMKKHQWQFALAAVALALAFFDPLMASAVGMLVGAALVTSIESQGVTFGYSDGGSPSSFSSIGNIVSFSGPGGSASVIDVSNLDSTFREKRMGLPDEGQFTVEINLDPDNTSHLALKTARAARTRLEFRLTLTDTTATRIGFFGYVLNYQLSGGVDQIVKASVTIEIDGSSFWV